MKLKLSLTPSYKLSSRLSLRIITYFVINILTLWVNSSYAGNFADALNKMGIMSNANRPGVVQDQLGGYMTGGSMHTRNSIQDRQLFNIQLPSFKSGCGGSIDAFMGGFGYINMEGIKSLISNIGSAAAGYAPLLLIKSISPEAGDIVSQLESMARFINNQNINTCQLGGSIAAGLWPKNAASQELACKSRMLGDKNIGSAVGNYFTASHDCGKQDMSQTNKNEFKGILGTEFNLVWHALKKAEKSDTTKYFSDSDKEELMSISGTLLSIPTGDGSVKLTHKNSLVKDEKLIEKLVFGNEAGKANYYSCVDKEKCLQLSVKARAFNKEDAYIIKIKKIVSSIAEKFVQEAQGQSVALSSEEKRLVSTTSIPIIKIIMLEKSLKGFNVSLAVEEYAEMVAFDYLVNYLDNMLDHVYKAVANLEYAQLEGEQIKNFKEEVRFIKSYLLKERQGAFEKMNTLLAVKQRMFQIENMVKAQFSEFRDS